VSLSPKNPRNPLPQATLWFNTTPILVISTMDHGYAGSYAGSCVGSHEGGYVSGCVGRWLHSRLGVQHHAKTGDSPFGRLA